MASTYLPPGWTEKNFHQHVLRDGEALTDEQRWRLRRRLELSIMAEEVNKRREEHVEHDLQIVLKASDVWGKPWGFLVFRGRGTYDSDGEWARFKNKFDAIVQRSFESFEEEAYVVDRVVRDNFKVTYVEDPRLDGLPLVAGTGDESATTWYSNYIDPERDLRLALDLILYIDKESLTSILSYSLFSPQPRTRNPPFVKFLDAKYTTDDPDNELDGFPGVFKVDMGVLVSDIYPLLVVGVSAREMWKAREDFILDTS